MHPFFGMMYNKRREFSLENEYFIFLSIFTPTFSLYSSCLSPFLFSLDKKAGRFIIGGTVINLLEGGAGMERKVVGQRGRFASYVATLPGDGTLVLEPRSGIYYWSLPGLVTLFSKLCRKEI